MAIANHESKRIIGYLSEMMRQEGKPRIIKAGSVWELRTKVSNTLIANGSLPEMVDWAYLNIIVE